MIEVRGLNVAYPIRGKVFSQDLVFQIADGEFLGICGANGCGKSTLLKLIGYFLPEFEGEIRMDGVSSKQEGAYDLFIQKIGFVFQNPENQLIATTVEDEIMFGLENLSLSREEIATRVAEVLQFTGLTDKRSDDPLNLSDGEKQKLVFASILAMNPEYLFLDEPTSMLDPLSAKSFFSLLWKIKPEKRGILLVSHTMEELMYCDRICFIKDGYLRFYENPYTFFCAAEQEEIEITPWMRFLLKRARSSTAPTVDTMAFSGNKTAKKVFMSPKEAFETFDRL